MRPFTHTSMLAAARCNAILFDLTANSSSDANTDRPSWSDPESSSSELCPATVQTSDAESSRQRHRPLTKNPPVPQERCA